MCFNGPVTHEQFCNTPLCYLENLGSLSDTDLANVDMCHHTRLKSHSHEAVLTANPSASTESQSSEGDRCSVPSSNFAIDEQNFTLGNKDRQPLKQQAWSLVWLWWQRLPDVRVRDPTPCFSGRPFKFCEQGNSIHSQLHHCSLFLRQHLSSVTAL